MQGNGRSLLTGHRSHVEFIRIHSGDRTCQVDFLLDAISDNDNFIKEIRGRIKHHILESLSGPCNLDCVKAQKGKHYDIAFLQAGKQIIPVNIRRDTVIGILDIYSHTYQRAVFVGDHTLQRSSIIDRRAGGKKKIQQHIQGRSTYMP